MKLFSIYRNPCVTNSGKSCGWASVILTVQNPVKPCEWAVASSAAHAAVSGVDTARSSARLRVELVSEQLHVDGVLLNQLLQVQLRNCVQFLESLPEVSVLPPPGKANA